jgi:hypothetical protein
VKSVHVLLRRRYGTAPHTIQNIYLFINWKAMAVAASQVTNSTAVVRWGENQRQVKITSREIQAFPGSVLEEIVFRG